MAQNAGNAGTDSGTAVADEHESSGDARQDFIDRTAAKYEKEDDAGGADVEADAEEDDAEDAGAADSADDDTDGSKKDDDADADDADAEEHTDADTSDADPDGDDAESEKDSEEDDDDEHPEDEESKDSDDDDADSGADATEEEEENTEGELSDEVKAVAEQYGIPLTVDDVPEGPARTLVKQKLKNIEVAVTRALQDARSYRSDEAKFRAEEKFRTDNPALVIVEMLQKGGDELFTAVNDRMAKLEDPDAKEVFESLVKGRRGKALEDVTKQLGHIEQRAARSGQVEALARREAAARGLPWKFAERAIVQALNEKGGDNPDLTDAEVQRIIITEAKEINGVVRKGKRDESREAVKNRTAAKKKASPASKSPKGAASPRPSNGEKKPKIDHNNAESRTAAMMATARKLFPGRRD